MDEADISSPRIQAVIDDGIARARRALDSQRLAPIVTELDGVRFGVCHYCESPIKPGHLFCAVDMEEPEHSCGAEWEREYLRKKAGGL